MPGNGTKCRKKGGKEMKEEIQQKEAQGYVTPYEFKGKLPLRQAIPLGLQHVLAMFVANVTPVMLIAGVAVYNGEAFTAIDTALLIQAAMLIAGIGTLIQLYPVWRIGSRLPVVMGLSFTFLSAMMTLASRDYGLMIGATSFAIGIGVTQVPEFFSGMPKIVSDIFAGNPVAGVFVISMILSLTLPKKVKMEDVGALTEDTIDSKKPE